MAVEIPVVIDIDKAFEDAASRVGTAMKPLQDYVDSEALKIRLKIDENSSKNLDSILKNASLSSKQLNNALTDVERKIQKLASKKNSFDMAAGLTDKETQLLQTYTILQRRITGIGNTSTATQKLISINITKVQKEIDKLSAKIETVDKGSTRFNNLNNKLVVAKQNLASLNAELSKVRAQDSLGGLESSLTRSNSRLVTLLKNSARLIALHSAGRFIKNIREVTAEFEMQRVALGGIIQDTEQANQLFRQIKAAAIESPFQIKDLVSYTKQLSAYRIETANLFDVTKRLADVSAGLGVDMGRLILAYGQVRAASVLRGQELRQFTEAGIPLVELLAKKFSDLNGSMVTTGEVFDLISKRAVPFEMIAEIFEDMTDKGGTFYKMQEKQAETLAGQWANLKDAISIMYDEIGNTTAVHKAMETLMADARYLMTNWRQVGTIVGLVAVQFAAFKVVPLFLKNLSREATLAQKANIALAKATELEAAATGKANIKRSIAIAQLKQYAKWSTRAAEAQSLAGRGIAKVFAGFLGGGWISVAVTALTVLAGWLISARQEANRLTKELDKIGSEGAISINRSVSNFQRLANAAVEAADGSNEQNKALEELKRTYGDLIPSENLQIEKLRQLSGDYSSLTSAIEQKINMQIREQKINAATDYYAGKISKSKKGTKKLLQQYGLDKEQINAVIDEVQRAIDDGLIGVEMSVAEKTDVFEKIIKDLTGIVVDFGNGFRDYQGVWHQVNDTQGKALKSLLNVSNVYGDLNTEVEGIRREMSSSVGTMGVYAKAWENLQKEIKDVTVSEEEFGKSTTFSYKKEKIRKEVEVLAKAIEDAFKGTNIDISEAFNPKGTINFKFLSEAVESSDKWGLAGYVKNIQNVYESLVPSNPMVGVIERKFQEISSAVGLSMNDVQGYLLRGEKDMESYAKEVAENLEAAQSKVKELQMRVKDYEAHPFVALPVKEEDLAQANAFVQFFEMLSQFVSGFAKKSSGSGSGTDPFITLMQNRIKFMQDFKRGYDDLNKYMSSSEAQMEEANIMLGRGQSLGLGPDEQLRAVNDLSKWYEDMIKQVQDNLRAKGIKGATPTDFLSVDTAKKGKAIQDLQKLLQQLWDAKTDYDTSQKKKDIEDALKRLSEEIKQTETARNFYQDILDLTGDEQLAATLGVSIYGNIGQDFKDRLQQQLNEAMKTLDASALTDEMRTAFANQDFETILANLDKFPEEWRSRLKEMAADSYKFQADRAKDLLKALEGAKTYAEQQVELAKQTAKRTAQIQAMDVKDDVKNQLLKQNARKEAEESAKIAYEAFKDTPMYIELFSDLDAASLRMLTNMRENLVKMKDNWKNLHPRELKELQSRLNELDEQIAQRNPFKALANSIKAYRDLQKQRSTVEVEEAAIAANQRLQSEEELLQVYREEYLEVEALGKDHEAEAMVAREKMEIQQQAVDAAKEEADAAQQTAYQYKNAKKHIQDAAEKMQEWAGYVTDSLGGIQQIVGTFASDDTAETFDIIAEGLGKTVSGAAELGQGIAKLVTGDLSGIVDTIRGLGDVVAGTFGTKNQLNIKKLNKKIDEQQDLLDGLTYSYDRLEKAMAKAFGSDYIYNYNEQLKNLRAQQAAYEEQLRLEQNKGKKKDKDKIKDYQDSIQEVEDQIIDMSGGLSEFFTGSDVKSAAEEFANSWIEAYQSFSSTTGAMQEKFQDMIGNMITQSLAGQMMQRLLQPIFDEIDRLSEDGELTAAEIGSISDMATAAIPQIDAAMTGLVNNLAGAGINLRQQAGQFTGISRDIAGASEESILGLAAAVNTANFYISHVPTISENVAAIREVLTGEAVPGRRNTAATRGDVEGPTYEDQMLAYAASIPLMRDDTATIRALLERVIKPVGTTATHYVSIR